MKKTWMVLMVGLLLSVFAKAQVPGEAFPLVNSLSGLWTSGKTEAAVDSTIRLNQVYPPLLIECLHNSLAQYVKQERFRHNADDYLEALIKRNNPGVNRIIKPLYVWSKTIANSDRVQLEKRFSEMVQVLGDSSDYETNAERYALLMLNEPTVQQLIDKGAREKLLLAVIRNLERYTNLTIQVKNRNEMEKRAWNRYLLAYAYYSRYTLFDRKEEYLLKASQYSPDEQDVQVKAAYFYDAALLTGNVQQIGFQQEYLNYLTGDHRTTEALALQTEITFNAPTDQNLKALKDVYALEPSQIPFTEYWHRYFNQKSKKVPSLKINYVEGTLDLTKNRDHWVYVDVWGTWCSPCVEELPTLQAYFVANSMKPISSLKIFTFSYSSVNLGAFMKEKGFTFPVFEIDKKINDAFEVSSYPSKLLISPEGFYIKIPFNADWRMYIKNYSLLEAQSN